ncbi:uncharacterized protein [Palaemon carinicauda]|uniref:uncharacterized protein n=1 Tax=Palaemon carinicauda TaxID=392227 RepID=UPI0035B67960
MLAIIQEELAKYEVLQCRTTEKLIKRRSTRQKSPLCYVSIEETFDVVKSTHISTGHVGRDRMLKELQNKYANIPIKDVELFNDNRSEFTTQVITELKEVWPKQTLVHGKPRHPQKNSALHSGINWSPYSTMFGCEARVGLTTSSLPMEVNARMETEEDLLAVTPISPVSSVENHRVAERIKEIKRRRHEAADAHTSQAERMVKRSRVDLRDGEQGDNVAVPVPLVDRERGDPRNILGVIIDRREDTDQYKIAVKACILSGLYSRNQFDLCPQRLLNIDNMNTEKTVSLRSAVISQSASGGQGFTRCDCAGAQKCSTRRCKCLKAGLLCNSRCYNSLNCCNK